MIGIGNCISEFLEADPSNFASSWESYMRMPVNWDVRKPIRGEFRLRKEDGEWFTLTFSFERLPMICFIFGYFGHTDRFCPRLLEFEPGKAVRKFFFGYSSSSEKSAAEECRRTVAPFIGGSWNFE